MKTITAIEPQKHNPRRVNIYLDGEFAFGLSTLVAAWLKVGQALPPEKAADLRHQDAREEAMQRAMRSLGRRARSAQELRESLAKAEIDSEVIESTLQRLRELNLLDDAAFARAFISDRQRFHPRAASVLRYELRKKGIDEATARDALQEQADDASAALAAAEKAARRFASLPWPLFRQKLGAWLGRRGFGWQIANQATRQTWQSLHGQAPPGTGTDHFIEENEESV